MEGGGNRTARRNTEAAARARRRIHEHGPAASIPRQAGGWRAGRRLGTGKESGAMRVAPALALAPSRHVWSGAGRY
jgi:hypothetical protein